MMQPCRLNFKLVTTCFDSELHLYSYLKMYSLNNNGNSPSLKNIETNLGWSIPKILRTINKMKHIGHLSVKRLCTGNVYDLSWYDNIVCGEKQRLSD